MKNKIVSRPEWIEARKVLLEKEKAFTKARDELARERRALPRVKLQKHYRLDGTEGQVSLEDLFRQNSQLVIYHFMFGPDWEIGCKHCSFWADNFNGIIPHLAARDVSFAAVSNAPLQKLLAFRDRMGWSFNWFSAIQCEFNQDFHVTMREQEVSMYNYREVPPGPPTERPGISVFFRDDEDHIFHTYSTYARGLEDLNNTYRYLDIVPKGRDEEDLRFAQEWVKLHDEY